MKKLSFLVAALCATTVFANAQTVTVDLTAGKFTAADEASSVPAFITWTTANDNITITQTQGSSATAVNKSYIAAPRVYKGHILSFVCAENYTITGIDITYTGSYSGAGGTTKFIAGTSVAENAVTDNTEAITRTIATANNGTHKFTTTNTAGLDKIYLQNPADATKQLRFTKIEITYIKAASTDPVIECANLDFGIVIAGADNSKTLEVVGENLTEAITASLESEDNFTVAGTLTDAGGTLTVSVNTSATGEVSTKLTLKSGETQKVVTLSANAVTISGAGTKDNPFSIEDVIKLNNWGENAWVEGYIIGALKTDGSAINNSQETNLALADAADESEVANMVSVKLPDDAIRTALNVKDNAGNIGKKVKVYGLLESYINHKGVTNVTEYVLESSPVTALEQVALSGIYAVGGTIEGIGATGRIFTVSGMDVTSQNGSLTSGIYIVKLGEQTQKIAIK